MISFEQSAAQIALRMADAADRAEYAYRTDEQLPLRIAELRVVTAEYRAQLHMIAMRDLEQALVQKQEEIDSIKREYLADRQEQLDVLGKHAKLAHVNALRIAIQTTEDVLGGLEYPFEHSAYKIVTTLRALLPKEEEDEE